jgi:2-dehydropantoate 2-reductase
MRRVYGHFTTSEFPRRNNSKILAYVDRVPCGSTAKRLDLLGRATVDVRSQKLLSYAKNNAACARRSSHREVGYPQGMNIAVLGAGRIGSTFAFYLANAGHNVTVIARGARLEALRSDGAIIAADGRKANVAIEDTLDVRNTFDLLLVTVLAHQVDALLPELKASAAVTIMLMFNTFEKLERLRNAVGRDRFCFAFPTMTAFFTDGKLKSTVTVPGMVTTTDSQTWAAVFARAGLPSKVEHDMESFLRSHVALMAPLMAGASLAHARSKHLQWAEVKTLTAALLEGLTLVSELGHPLKPASVRIIARLPAVVLTSMIWLLSRTKPKRDLGELGPTEARALIDAMIASAPEKTPKLSAVRP